MCHLIFVYSSIKLLKCKHCKYNISINIHFQFLSSILKLSFKLFYRYTDHFDKAIWNIN